MSTTINHVQNVSMSSI